MGACAVFALIAFPAAALAVWFRRPVEQTLAPSCMLLIALLYVAGIAGVLPAGIWLCAVLAVASACFLVVRIVKKKQPVYPLLCTPGGCLFALLYAGAWMAHLGRQFSSWDEFSHWGLVVKNMCLLDAMGNSAAATTYFKGYPPAAALFEYLFCKLSGGFAESAVFCAMNVLLAALMVPVFKNVTWKKLWRMAPVLFCVWLVPTVFFPDFMVQIYVDALLGVWFAWMLYLWFTERRFSGFAVLCLTLGGAVLTLTKASGTGLALIALTVAAADALAGARARDVRPALPQGERGLAAFVRAALPFAGVLAAKQSWAVYLRLTHTAEAWDMGGLTFQNLMDFVQGDAPAYRYGVCTAFFAQFFKADMKCGTVASRLFTTSIFVWLTLFLLAGLWLIWTVRESRWRSGVRRMLAGVWIGFALYAVSLLVLYLFTYMEYEAVHLSSFTRYLSTYLVGMGLLLAYLVVETLCGREDARGRKAAFAGGLCFMLLFGSLGAVAGITLFNRSDVAKSAAVRAPLAEVREAAKELTAADTVYLVAQHTKGFEYWVERYELTPVPTSPNYSWSLGKPYGEEDIWTRNISCDAWRRELAKDYTYVYVYTADEQFSREFGEAFADAVENNALYRVEKQGDTCVLERAG